MRIDIITLFPGLIEPYFMDSMMKRAIEKGCAEVYFHNPREFGIGKHKQVDDYMFGGGAGMVMLCEPLSTLIENLKKEHTYDEIIYLTPEGKTLNQAESNRLSLQKNLLLICGHYKGIDQRLRDLYVTCEISIGDYVISGGELAAAVLCDSIIRVIPGVLGDETSALTDSFQDGLLSPPVYTRPVEFKGLKVPEVLLGGDHAAIEKWRMEKSVEITRQRRPDLLSSDE
ncbi:MAG: tRNA (guanosine(37)-N1)-methyltransferase TrmD [Flavobacteriales bacterium]